MDMLRPEDKNLRVVFTGPHIGGDRVVISDWPFPALKLPYRADVPPPLPIHGWNFNPSDDLAPVELEVGNNRLVIGRGGVVYECCRDQVDR